MFEELYVEGFQGFGQATAIPLAPLTLIFGPNSSGKSSILRALRLVQQSVREHDPKNPKFVSNGSLIDLGSFQTLVHRHEISRKMTLGISYKHRHDVPPVALKFVLADAMRVESLTLSFIDQKIAPDQISLTFTQDSLGPASAAGSPWTLDEDSLLNLRALDAQALNEHNGTRRHSEPISDEAQKNALDQSSRVPWFLNDWMPQRSPMIALSSVQGKEKPESDARLIFSSIVGTNSILDSKFSRFFSAFGKPLMPYIGPLRTIPERLTFETGIRESGLADGRDIASALAGNAATREVVSDWLFEVTNGVYRLAYLPISSEATSIFGEAGALALHDLSNDCYVAFADVGTGLSQVLPILEKLALPKQVEPRSTTRGKKANASRFASQAQTILVEQPELHLHPRMQADLMSLFVKYVSEGGRGDQVIAETHSESMILRLQAEISSGVISPDQVSILYVDKDSVSGSTTVQKMRIGQDGEFLTKWPESFSDLRYKEIVR